MDEYIALAMGRIRAQLRHIATGVMTGIIDVFPLDEKDEDDPISLKKILKKEGSWAVFKDVIVFDFDGNHGEHTIRLTE